MENNTFENNTNCNAINLLHITTAYYYLRVDKSTRVNNL